MPFDLNCDLGEGEPPARTRALMRCVTSVNLACGGHAGDAATMERVVRLAKLLGVRVGAHPGLPGGFGRAETAITPGELRTLVLQQAGALHRLTEVHRVRLHHVKLHGALYHAVERDPALARAYLDAVGTWFRRLPVYALAGGRVAALGRELGVPVWEEAFLDRAYRADGSLVPRTEPEALVTRPRTIEQRLRGLLAGQGIESVTGSRLALRPRTLCLHGDSPGAVMLARRTRALLDRRAGLVPGRR